MEESRKRERRHEREEDQKSSYFKGRRRERVGRRSNIEISPLSPSLNGTEWR
jgi:hypothetical protein